jgi:hypothetical protein
MPRYGRFWAFSAFRSILSATQRSIAMVVASGSRMPRRQADHAALIAAISGLTPMMFKTRVRL